MSAEQQKLEVPNDPVSKRIQYWGEALNRFGWPPVVLGVSLYLLLRFAAWVEPLLKLVATTHVEAVGVMQEQQQKIVDILQKMSVSQESLAANQQAVADGQRAIAVLLDDMRKDRQPK